MDTGDPLLRIFCDYNFVGTGSTGFSCVLLREEIDVLRSGDLVIVEGDSVDEQYAYVSAINLITKQGRFVFTNKPREKDSEMAT